MLLQMSNHDENTSKNWLQEVYFSIICGGVLSLIVGLVLVFLRKDSSWSDVLFSSIALGLGSGLGGASAVILRKVSGIYHFTILGALMGAITGLVIFVFPFSDDRLPEAKWIPFVFCSIGGAVVATGIGLWDSKYFRRKIISWFQKVFKTRLSKVLGSIFAVVFTVEFFLKADTDSNHRKIWEGILSGGWHGAVAVLMVLAGVVLWKLATKDAPKT